jgi:hypothetical protein
MNPPGGRFGLPADFLIARDGNVLACKYGAHVYDQWSVDEFLTIARQSSGAPCQGSAGGALEPERALSKSLIQVIDHARGAVQISTAVPGDSQRSL